MTDDYREDYDEKDLEQSKSSFKPRQNSAFGFYDEFDDNGERFSEVEQDDQNSFGYVHFADRQIPSDIMRSAQDAMLNQADSSYSYDFRRAESPKQADKTSEDEFSVQPLQEKEQEETTDQSKDNFTDLITDSSNNNQSQGKISKAKLLEKLPKKKIDTVSPDFSDLFTESSFDHFAMNRSNRANAEANGPESVSPSSSSSDEAFQRMMSNFSSEVSENDAKKADLSSEQSSSTHFSSSKSSINTDHSFKDEIMVRLQQEANSYLWLDDEKQDRETDDKPKAKTLASLSSDQTSKSDDQLLSQSSTSSSNLRNNSFFQFTDAFDKAKEEKEAVSSSRTVQDSEDYVYPGNNETEQEANINIHLAENHEFASDASEEDAEGLAETKRFKISKDETQKLAIKQESLPSRAERLSQGNSSRKRNAYTNKSSKVGRVVGAALALIILATAAGGYLYVSSSIQAVDANSKTEQTVHIPNNSSSTAIGRILEKKHLVKNGTIFSIYSKFKGHSDFKSGYYTLSKSQDADEIALALEKGGSATLPAIGKITIPEGYDINQIATAVTVNAEKKNASSPFSKDEFLKIVQDENFINEMKKRYPELFASLPSKDSGVKYQLEGYLFPATYDYTSKTTMKELVEQMIAAEDQNLKPIYPKLAALNMNVNDLLSLSSIVEKEVNTKEDRENVADIFLKRLNSGMTLGSNAAVLYAEGKLGTNVTAEDDKNIDTQIDSPYNLYMKQGTGPGPIASPSMMSINAVLNHPDNPYYYFLVSSKDGKTYYATTQEEQDANIAQYLN